MMIQYPQGQGYFRYDDVKVKICKSCKKQAETLHQGYCEQCLAINVVKDWLKTDGVR